ncbi:hypothetical protein BABINDRAFT_163682 [Babjeviella inositovora NRRL Y-12698]|uniref:Uncharacterized protein n=1 Tax=Babjeviella inositovora NRRL Y-12698 TaxID=984486 RepID=A0A1E3QHQ6_9ASCO|nr:uncharacterized protein BABINDRAFT_163682 [Babjeviella inositovora NRRL Y-12698]ODQ77170.1 hypothetical protein BABINDRAFT_163682 [Babjeviella inositovora NRRL Y-12698]
MYSKLLTENKPWIQNRQYANNEQTSKRYNQPPTLDSWSLANQYERRNCSDGEAENRHCLLH